MPVVIPIKVTGPYVPVVVPEVPAVFVLDRTAERIVVSMHHNIIVYCCWKIAMIILVLFLRP